MNGLEGRHVVVTGGAGALGQSVVRAFAQAGAIAHVPVRRAPPSTSFSTSSSASPSGVRFIAGVDLTDEAAVVNLYANLPDVWASVHVAGGFAMSGIVETSLADLRALIDVNLITTFLCCREAVRCFRARPGGGGGRIVNVASRAALVADGGMAAYSLAKAAVVSLTATLAEEVATDGILVNAVAPGTIDTPKNRRDMPGTDPGRMVSPERIASVIAWLASPDNAIGSGGVIPVYGTS